MSDTPQEHNAQIDEQSSSEPSYQMRNESRVNPKKLSCCKGRVADITGSGMRMIVSNKDVPEVGDVQSYTFADNRTKLTISGQVKWVRKGTAFTRRCEVGVEFTKTDPATRDAILKLAVTGSMGMARDRDITVEFPNLYKLLNVACHASASEITTAYRKEAQRWHPDVNDAPNAAQRFDELHKAYTVLHDEETRAKYDARFFSQDQRAA